jgi:putative methionine-R-sulfoxide reductase with GAF domain
VQYQVSATQGSASVKVEAEDWLSAFSVALPQLGVSLDSVERLVFTQSADGHVDVSQGGPRPTWHITPPPPNLEIRVSSRSQLEEEELPPMEIPTGELGLDGQVIQPVFMPESRLHREAPESLAERLFDLSMDIATAEGDEPYELALELLLEFVPADAASVARGTLNDPSLVFVAATGPVADQIKGREVAFGEGLVGMCFDVRSTIVVDDVDGDTRHLDQFDTTTGFETVAVMCVPIFDSEQGLIYGVIQLLNPPGRGFRTIDKDNAEAVADSLARALSQRG